MSNVIDQLADLGAPADHPVSEDVVRKDMARGRAARRRRRLRRGVTGRSATAVAAVAVVATISGQQAGDTDGNNGLDLIAYDGAQLPGFTVGKVPEGFVLQGANEYSLEIARPDDTSSLDDFSGKLVVMLQSVDATETPTGKAVEVDGRPGTISKVDPAGAQLFYTDGEHDIVVQSATELGLTDADLVDFAQSVTVTTNAQAGRG
jgi:hypothetical protein